MTNEQRQQFKTALKAAIQRKTELTAQRQEIEKELAQQNKAVAALSELLGESAQLEIGLTEATLLFIRSSNADLTATEIRNGLRGMGYDIDAFSNPMASLHQVLIRLKDKGMIDITKGKDGKKRFARITDYPDTNPAGFLHRLKEATSEKK